MDPTIDHVLDGLVERLDHVSVAVWDIARAAPFAGLLGGRFREGGLSFGRDFRWVQWDLPNGKLEMIQPVDGRDDDHFLVRFLRSRGEGVHHLTLKVTDLAEAVERARAAGFRVVGERRAPPTWREAFVHPRSACGVLVPLAAWRDGPPPPRRTLAEALAEAP